MPESKRQQWIEDLRVHERAVERISRSLQDLAEQPRAEKQAVFLNAQITRHRISMALLAARLEEGLAVS